MMGVEWSVMEDTCYQFGVEGSLDSLHLPLNEVAGSRTQGQGCDAADLLLPHKSGQIFR